MPLIETLVAAVGPAIAKTVLKLWAGDNKVSSEGIGSTIEALTKLIPEIRARNEAERQLNAIGERAAESLMFTFETEGKQLLIDDQETVADLVAQTLDHSKINVELLVQRDLDPVLLAQHFVTEATAQLSLLPEHRARLFIRVIQEASQSIIDIARVLPNFSERTFAELLRRDRVLIDAAQRTFESLDRIRLKADDQEAEAAQFDTEYRRAVIRNLNKVELFGVDLSRASRSHPLSVAYVSLDVSGSPKDRPTELGEMKDQEDEEEEEESAVHTIEIALAAKSRLVVRGPAGAGKTTLVHWIAVRAASRDFESPLENWNDVLPFVVRLRQFGDSALPRPEHFPSLVAPTIADTMPRGWVHRLLHSGRAVVMVDGVDEVAESRRSEVRKWLKELVDTFSGCRFIITSRPHAVEQHWLRSEAFYDADLQPMDTIGIETFIDHWHMAVAEEVQREEEIPSLGRLALNLKTTLRRNRAIRRLATNPLLCSVICALHRDTNEQLPEDRLDLYERCCSMLLERRDPESGLRVIGYPRLTYRQKRSLLCDLAYWMLKNNWSEVSRASAQGRLDKKIETLRRDGRDGVLLSGDSALRFFLERSGILREPVVGKLDFAHRTFQEFMAANAAIAEGDIGVLLSNATNPQWREVVVLGSGLARPSERARLVESLLSKGDTDLASRPQLHLLAAACLDAAVDVDSSLRKEVELRIERLFPPKNVSAAMQVADAAGDMALPFFRRGQRYLNARQSAACVRGLAIIGSVEAVRAIAEYADEYSSLVLREVVRAADRIDPGMFLDLVAPRLNPTRLPGDAVARAIAKFGMEKISNLKEARELSLSGDGARGLSIIQQFPNLECLNLTGPYVIDLTPLSSLRELRSVTLASAAVNDLSPLKRVSKLERLSIRYTNFDANHLAGMIQLKSLDVWGATISNSQTLSSLTGMQTLMLLDTDVDLAFLRNMTGINNLTLSGFAGADLSPIGCLYNLESLYVSRAQLKDIRWMSALGNLQTFELYSTEISDLSCLPTLPKLEKLSLKGSSKKAELVRAFRQQYPNVRIAT